MGDYAVAGAVSSVASQGASIALGIQDKFSFNSVALSAISAGVGAAFGGDPTTFIQGLKQGLKANAITQGIGIATGLQERFSWAGLAAAGVGGGVGGHIGDSFGDSFGGQIAKSGAVAIANAATRSAIEGSSFGDNIIAAIPDVIGQAVGSSISGALGLNDNPTSQTQGGLVAQAIGGLGDIFTDFTGAINDKINLFYDKISRDEQARSLADAANKYAQVEAREQARHEQRDNERVDEIITTGVKSTLFNLGYTTYFSSILDGRDLNRYQDSATGIIGSRATISGIQRGTALAQIPVQGLKTSPFDNLTAIQLKALRDNEFPGVPGGYYPGDGSGRSIVYVTDPETGIGSHQSVPSQPFTPTQLRNLGQALVTASNVGLPSSAAGGFAGINSLLKGSSSVLRNTRKSFITTPIKPIHKNSNSYVGPTHVYVIRKNGVPWKVGESAQGTKIKGNQTVSIRAERQATKLARETGDRVTTEIIANTGAKKGARQFETYLIKEYRKIYGPDSLPGNKGTR